MVSALSVVFTLANQIFWVLSLSDVAIANSFNSIENCQVMMGIVYANAKHLSERFFVVGAEEMKIAIDEYSDDDEQTDRINY